MMKEDNIVEVLDLDDNNLETNDVLENTSSIEELTEDTPVQEELSDIQVPKELPGNNYDNTSNMSDLPINNEYENQVQEQNLDVTSINPNPVIENKKDFNNDDHKYIGYQKNLIKLIIMVIIPLILLIISFTGYNHFKQDTSFYTENATASYQVCLKNNNYYKEKCLGEGVEYISSITDVIRLDLGYTVLSQSTQNKTLKYYVKSKVVVKTDGEEGKELLKKEKKLTKVEKAEMTGNVATFTKSVDISFQDYNNYVQNYKNDYSLLGKAELEVSLVVIDGSNKREVTSVIIPLTKSTYNISKNEIQNKNTFFKIKTNFIMKLLFIVLILVSLVFLILKLVNLIKYIIKTTPKESKYNKQLKHILNTYDRVIITLEDKNTIVSTEEEYTVKSFLELLDVRDTIDKPILYYKVNDVKTEFYVQDSDKTYKYVMKEADFEDNKK